MKRALFLRVPNHGFVDTLPCLDTPFPQHIMCCVVTHLVVPVVMRYAWLESSPRARLSVMLAVSQASLGNSGGCSCARFLLSLCPTRWWSLRRLRYWRRQHTVLVVSADERSYGDCLWMRASEGHRRTGWLQSWTLIAIDRFSVMASLMCIRRHRFLRECSIRRHSQWSRQIWQWRQRQSLS